MSEAAPFTELLTPRLRLRPFREADLPAFAAYRRDPEVCRYQSWDVFSDADLAGFWEDQRGLAFGLPGRWYQIAIADRAGDALLGDCATCLHSGNEIELGFTLPVAHWGRGLMREALAALFPRLAERWPAANLVARVDPRNGRSLRMLEALGFRREALKVRAEFLKGEWCDEVLCVRKSSRPGRGSRDTAPG